ncbi:hypothetical protein DASC09_051170 [Saccharomycopsis crataegensis]|uniref:Protein arginine methyltransferase NDUFAF7 n=1 Tax=Saccharomycopsis crataegensis TaxID=43959 RepID=A0AAV5QTQ4_9ASCO|nr:hypothetical protein DASC09_051170 [Saccharomycopsis crataegensis]
MLRVLSRRTSQLSKVRNFTKVSVSKFSNASLLSQEVTSESPKVPSYSRPKIRLDSLSRILVETIKTTGPLSLSSYMKTCLTHTDYGYYTTKDPLGIRSSGDFVTSPEISQMFGEMIGVWFFTVYLTQNKPNNVQFIEFGPGKGTLMHDLLKSFNQLLRSSTLKEKISIVMVEASPLLRLEQFELLCGKDNKIKESEDGIGYVGVTKWGNKIRWVDTEQDIEEIGHKDHSNYVVCHEFFDALPIKQFEKTEQGWRECLVDYILPEDRTTKESEGRLTLPSQTTIKSSDLEAEKEPSFHMTVSPKKTTSAFVPQQSPRHNALPIGSRVEISPETLTYSKKIHQIITSNEKQQGAALYIDYGPADTIPINTLRGIKDHAIVSPFVNPGTVDLSADVDFQGIKVLSENLGGVDVHGPVEQGDWLNELGMQYRAEHLINKSKNDADKERISKSYIRLVDKSDAGMGKIYKFMGILPKGTTKPVGFGGSVSE